MSADRNPAGPIRPADDDSRATARRLLATASTGSLATLDAATGHPFATLVTVATDIDGAPLILVSRLSGHTVNLTADPRVSLLVAQIGKGDPLAHPRLTLVAAARALAHGEDGKRARARFLARHPKAALYVDFPDFGFFALDVRRASLNGGFGKAYELTAQDVMAAGGE